MNIDKIATRQVFVTTPDKPLADAARQMRLRHIGALVVVAQREGATFPVGMLTDRDIVCGQIVKQADLHCLTVAEVMTPGVTVIRENQGVEEAIGLLRERGLRRAPVVNGSGELVGIVTLDDLLPALADELNTLAELIGGQAGFEPPLGRAGT